MDFEETTAGATELEALVARRIEEYQLLVAAQYPRILTLCQRNLRDEELAKNVAQEVFLKFFEYVTRTVLEGAEAIRNAPAWLTRVAHNECANEWRARYVRMYGQRPKKNSVHRPSARPRVTYRYEHESAEFADEDGPGLDEIPATGSPTTATELTPEENAMFLELLGQYELALGRLTPEQRTAFVLSEDHSLSPDAIQKLLHLDAESIAKLDRTSLRQSEIAAILGRNEGTVSSDLTRARHALRKSLISYGPQPKQASPISRWPTQYLVGWLSTRGSIRSLHLPQNRNLYPEGTHPILLESDKAFIRGLSRASDRFMIVRQIAAPRMHGLVPGWFSAPEPNPEFVNIIRDLKRARKHHRTIARILNDRGILSPYGTIWHETSVELVAFRFGLRKRRGEESTVFVSACPTILPAAAAAPERTRWNAPYLFSMTSRLWFGGMVLNEMTWSAVLESHLGALDSAAEAAGLEVSDLTRHRIRISQIVSLSGPDCALGPNAG